MWVHGTGAIAAPAGSAILIPGSMGTASYVGVGLGEPSSVASASHNAGRVMTRREARDCIRLDRHREDLNVVEEAAVLVQLMKAFRVGAEDAGVLIGRSYQQTRRLVQIHEAPQSIRDAVMQGHIDARAALELVRIYNRLAQGVGASAKQRVGTELDELIDRVVNERWSVRRL